MYVLFAFTYLLINTLLSKTRHQIQTQARQKLQKCPSQIAPFLFGAFFFFHAADSGGIFGFPNI